MFGLPTKDDGSRNDVLVGQNIVSGTHNQFDFDALRAASTRIFIAAEAESEGELAAPRGGGGGRTPRDHARHLPQRPWRVPRREDGESGDPDAFAATLRRVLGTEA